MANNNNKSKAKWTVMIYMAADDSTSNDASNEFLTELNNLGDILDNQTYKSINILLQVYKDWNVDESQPPNFRARRYKIRPSFLENISHPEIELSSDVRMGNEPALTDYIKWCKRKYEAERYLLLLWGHGTGSGLFATEISQAYSEMITKIPDFTLTELDSGNTVSITELLKPNSTYFNNSDEIQLGLSYTDEDNQIITDIITASKSILKVFKDNPKFKLRTNNPDTLIKLNSYITSRSNLDALIGRELNTSLTKCFGNNGHKLDLLVTLGCCMQMVEYGYDIQKFCQFYVASEELIFFQGYNYLDTFKLLIKTPDMNAEQLGVKFIEKANKKAFYNKLKESQLAISCVNLDKNDKLFDDLDKISSILNKNYEKLHPVILESRRKCSHFGESAYRSSFIDIVWFMKKLEEGLADANLYVGLQKRINRLITFIMKEYIIRKYIGERKKPRASQDRSMGGHGVAFYFPSSARDHTDDAERGKYFDKKEKDYVNTFSKKNEWNEVIFKFMKKVEGEEPKTPVIDEEVFMQMDLIQENIRLQDLIAEYI